MSENESPDIWTEKLKMIIGIFSAANFGLWVTLLYLVFHIEDYKKHPVRYESLAWPLIWLLSTALIAICIICLLLRDETRSTSFFKGFLPNASIIITEVAAFAFTIAYFYLSAVDKYFVLEWGVKTYVAPAVRAPGFALFGGYNDAASAHFTHERTKCFFPQWGNTSCEDMFPNNARTYEDGPYGNVTYYNFSPSDVTMFRRPTDQLLLQTTVTWNSSDLKEKYTMQAPQNPTLYSTMYDPRLNTSQFKTALDCGLLGWAEQPALGSNTYTIDEITHTFAKLGENSAHVTDQSCKTFINSIHKIEGGYTTYKYHISSSGTSFSSICDVNGTVPFNESCTTQVLLRMGSFRASNITSKHGRNAVEIFTDISGIVGAVAYVAWYLTIFQ
ncbi:hypothetical protein LTR10_011115 [Elasticomyces elasticus]|nr:hypothetical protein LTR10_011115 [Elasticomyces elasticus]